MKFGKDFTTHLEETLPEWRDKFLCYKPLKKLLKNFNPQVSSPPVDLNHLQRDFVRTLSEELRKFNTFYLDKDEDFVIRLQDLKDRIGRIKENSGKGDLYSSECEFGEEVMDIRNGLVRIHGEMVLLMNYSSLNLAGLMKILKKYDKRTGGSLCLPFTQLALRQPFFDSGPIKKLVLECEEYLDKMFPLEAEIIDSNQNDDAQAANLLAGNGAILAEETRGVYRSTIAAINTIRGLKKESSTYNPISISALYKEKDNESVGAVTSDNSATNSPAA